MIWAGNGDGHASHLAPLCPLRHHAEVNSFEVCHAKHGWRIDAWDVKWDIKIANYMRVDEVVHVCSS